MSIDLVEGLLRHTGYLNTAYVRLPNEERLKQFHEGEASLYITRADHRIQGGKLDALTQHNKELVQRLEMIESAQATIQKKSTEITAALSPEAKKAALSSMTKDEMLALLKEIAESK